MASGIGSGGSLVGDPVGTGRGVDVIQNHFLPVLNLGCVFLSACDHGSPVGRKRSVTIFFLLSMGQSIEVRALRRNLLPPWIVTVLVASLHLPLGIATLAVGDCSGDIAAVKLARV